LRSGHGRVVLDARNRQGDPLLVPVLVEAALKDLRQDRHCEAPRAGWLYAIIRTAALEDEVLKALLETTSRGSSEISRTDAIQVREILDLFARDGWDEAAPLGPHPRTLHPKAGRAQAPDLTDAVKKIDIAEQRRRYRQSVRSISTADIIAAVRDGGRLESRFEAWGLFADEDDLAAVEASFLRSADLPTLKRGLRLYRDRAPTEVTQPLIDLAHHSDRLIRLRARKALTHSEDDAVRNLALAELNQGRFQELQIEMLKGRYRRSDDLIIASTLDLVRNGDDLHQICTGVIRLFTDRTDGAGHDLLLYVYDRGHCGICRRDALEALAAHQGIPEWIRAEAPHDAEEAVRRSSCIPRAL
jgi:hypothetical protein